MEILFGVGLVLAVEAALWFALKAWRGCKRDRRWSGKSATRFEFEAAN